jgi:microcystin-dependent protein
MADPFLGEIRLTSFNFAPKGWAMCNGQLLPINQNQPLFSLFGTMYGGNGQTNFALPDLRGRVAMHRSNSFTQGQRGGETAHTLTNQELPQHIHVAAASAGDADVPVPGGGRLASFNNGYGAPANPTTLAPATITNAGGSQAHQNMAPYLVLNYVVALIGIFPSQT